jgi:CO/xanthine dehydrogenase Mo-binding subunit
MVIIPLLSRQTFRKIKGVLRIWAVILAANLIGAQVVAGKTPTPYLNEYGARRIGEIGLTGSASAVASAVYHPPGVAGAVPIRVEKLP